VDGRVSPGQLTLIWDDFGSLRGGSTKFDAITSDVVKDGVLAFGFSTAAGVNILDAKAVNGSPDQPQTTSIPIVVNITNPTFTLADLDLSLSLTHANLNELLITLTSPGGDVLTLVQNGVNNSGTTIPNQGISGVNMGVFSVATPPPANLNAATVFDTEAARTIRQGTAPFVGRFQPEGAANDTVTGLDAFNTQGAAALNGTWTLKITDEKSETTANGAPTQRLSSWSLNFTGGLTTGIDAQVATTHVLGALNAPYALQPAVNPTIGIGPGAEIAADNTLGSFSQYQGRLYVTYVDHRPVTGNPSSNTDIFLAVSDDGGASWSVQSVLNSTGSTNFGGEVNDDNNSVDGFSAAANDGGRTQFQPALAVDQNTGTLVLTWLDARNDPTNSRVATYIGMSVDGGGSFSKQTYINSPNSVTDSVTGKTFFRGPIPDNESSSNTLSEGSNVFSFGDQHGVAAAGGHVVSVWSGNENGGIHANERLAILGSTLNIAAGPRIISSTTGVVSQSGDFVNPAATDGTPLLRGFQVQFDRPIDPATFTTDAITVFYRDSLTSGTVLGTPIPVGSIIALDAGQFGPAQIDGATRFFVLLEKPQTAAGTYAYYINPTESDRVRTLNGTVTLGQTQAYTASGNQISLPIPSSGTGGPVSPANTTTSTIVINDPGADVVNNITVAINLTHTFDSDLTISLISPAGTTIVLSNRRGGSGDNFTNTIFDDTATTTIAAGTPPFTGSFKPDTVLSSFKGQIINGTWTLKIVDNAAIDTGTLIGWSMNIQHAVVGPSAGNKVDQNSNGTVGEPAVVGTTIGDVYSVPTPTAISSFQSSAVMHLALTPGANVNLTNNANGDYTAEPAIAVDPTNPTNIFVVADHSTTVPFPNPAGLIVATSSDGGVTWAKRSIADGNDTLPFGGFGQPSVSWDQFGNLFLTYTTVDNVNNTITSSVLVSTDAGQTFNVVGGPFNSGDRPNIVTGPGATPGTGSVFLTVHDTNSSLLQVYQAQVGGLGLIAPFSSIPFTIDPGTNSDIDFASGAVGPNADFVIAYETDPGMFVPSQILYTVIPAFGTSSSNTITNTNVGFVDSIPSAFLGTDSEPQLAFDRSGGAHNGRLYLAYVDSDSLGASDTNIFLRYSDDLGSTWSSPVQVDLDATGNSQFMPRLAVDQTTGNVALTWWDARNAGTANDTVQLFGAVSTDGGLTFQGANFSANAKIGTGVSDANATSTGSLGVYNGLAFNNGTLYPVWADNSVSQGDPDIFTAVSTFGQVTTNVGYFTPAFDATTLPLIVPGPHIVGTPQSSSSSASQNILPIPDLGTVTSTITINDPTAVASDLSVHLNILHGNDSDLIISLSSPNGSTVILSNHEGGTGQNFIDTIFDDLASTAISAGTAPFTGRFSPDSPLSAFNGTPLNGTWTLTVTDTVAGNTGTLVNWSMNYRAGNADNLTLNGTTNSITVQFDRDMDPTTFTPASILRMIGPAGRITGPFTITDNPLGTDPDPSNPRTYAINFPTQDLSGTYVLTLAASIRGKELTPGMHDGYLLDTQLTAGLASLRGQLNTSVPVTYNSTPAAPIGSATAAGKVTTSTITITDNYLINGATLSLNISYPSDPDLQAVLIAPDGTQITLFSNLPHSGANFTNTVFDSVNGTTLISSGSPTYFGTFRPQQDLTALLNKNVNGAWTLQITDTASGAIGTLNSWSLTFQKPVTQVGLTGSAADQAQVSFRIFTMDPTNPLAHDQWTAVGPAAIGSAGNSGRIGGLAVDPSDASGNTVYVAGASGGIWKTTNFLTTDAKGPTYIPLTDFGPTFAINIGGIAVFGRNNDPNQSIVFGLTGEGDTGAAGAGFIRSMDGGVTWALLDSTTNVDSSGNPLSFSSNQRDHRFVGSTGFKILVDPKPTPSGDVIVYAALSGPAGGIWRSLDTGAHWTLMRAGNADDVAFDPNSGTFNAFSNPTGNLQTIFAAFRGDGVYMSPNRGQIWNQMTGLIGDPLTRDWTNLINLKQPPSTAVGVTAPVDTPNGAKGRIVLAKPALFPSTVANYQQLNALYEGWLYAGVAKPDGSLDGLYMTKDFGQNWVKVRIPNGGGNPLIATPSNDISHNDVQMLGGNGGFNAQGNYDISLAVDPQNPAVVYFGGTTDGSPTGFIRVDTTFIHDSEAFYEDNSSNANAFGLNNINDAVNLRDWPSPTDGLATVFPNPVLNNGLFNGYINLLHDPNNPFSSGSSVNVLYANNFTNNGAGVSWLPFDISGTDQHRIWTMVDPFTGMTRIIIGDDQGVFTTVDNGGLQVGSFAGRILPSTSRNGNLQITQFYYGAAQPSNLAAQIAGAMFRGQAQDDGFEASPADVLTTGNIGAGYSGGDGDGGGVATDQTGTGTVYQYNWPCCGGNTTDFFQVNGIGRTFGLLQDSQGGHTPDPEWPFLGGVNFAVNPVNGNQVIISSTIGRIFGTIDQGMHWSVIGDPTALDGSQSLAMAYGAPGPAGQGGNDATNFLLYVGTNAGHIFATFNGGGANGNNWTNISNGLDGSSVNAIITNPNRGSHEVYAVTSTGVFHLVDSSVANPTWVRINGAGAGTSGNIFSVTHRSFGDPSLTDTQARDLTSIQADWRYAIPNASGGGTHPVLYVGGNSGVYRSLDNGATWSLFPDMTIDGNSANETVNGGRLPNVNVTDLDLSIGNVDPTTGMSTVAGSPDVLMATTYGRGLFAIRVAPLIIPGTFAMDTADDLGLSNSDGITSQITPHFMGTSEISAFGNTVHITLVATDTTTGDTFTGTGTTDVQGNFDIAINFPSCLHTYNITAQATDDAGVAGPTASSTLKYPNGVTIDTSQPTVASITSTAPVNSAFSAGMTVPIIVVFNEQVIVDTTKGIPTLTLNDGGTATYASGSGSPNLVFNYVVGAGQNTSDLDYNPTGLTIAAGAIVNAAGGIAITSLGGATDFLAPRNIVIDTIAPTVTAVDSPSQGDRAYGLGQTITITVTFSETVIVSGQPKLQLNSGGSANYTSGSNSNTLTFTYTVGANQNSTDLDYASINALTGTIRDAASNNAVLTLPAPGSSALKAKNIVIDTGIPGKPKMTSASDSGISNTDGITNNNKPTFTGLSANDGNGVVQLVVLDPNTNTVIGSPIVTGGADPTGFYSITLTSALADGAYRVAARSASGVLSTGFQDIVIDTHAPDFTVNTINAQTGAAFTGAVAHLNADAHPPVTSAFSNISITYGDGTPGTTLAAPGNGGDIPINHTWATAGQYFPQVTTSDAAGNSQTISDTANIADQIDLGPVPQVTISSSTINSGQKQRSHIDTIDFAFAKPTGFVGAFPSLDLSSLTLLHNGGAPVSLAGAILTYDVASGTGRVDLHNLVLADGDYQLQFNVGTDTPDFIDFFKLTGDANGDGIVNRKDLTAVASAQNATGALLEADVNNDGRVNADDTKLVKSRLNRKLVSAVKTVKLLANGKVSAPAMRFGRVKSGATVMAMDLVVKNLFGRDIKLSRAAIAGDSNSFHFNLPGTLWGSPNSSTITIPAGASVTIRVYVTPFNTPGATSAKLTCRYTDGGFISYGNAIASMNANIVG